MPAVVLICSSILAGPLFAPDAQARPQYKSVFQKMYPKVEKVGTKKVGCSVCHPQKSKKTRNHYGAALQEALDKKNEKNKARIKDALKKIENDSCPGSGQKWIERLEEGSLPCPHGGSGTSHRPGASYIGRQLAMPEGGQ
jgi:hypothetical protein